MLSSLYDWTHIWRVCMTTSGKAIQFLWTLHMVYIVLIIWQHGSATLGNSRALLLPADVSCSGPGRGGVWASELPLARARPGRERHGRRWGLRVFSPAAGNVLHEPERRPQIQLLSLRQAGSTQVTLREGLHSGSMTSAVIKPVMIDNALHHVERLSWVFESGDVQMFNSG